MIINNNNILSSNYSRVRLQQLLNTNGLIMIDEETIDDGTAHATPAIKYPLKVKYCGVCTMPIEYCEYSGITDRCLKWLEDNLRDEFDKLGLPSAQDVSDAEKKHQKRGGKGLKPTGEKPVLEKKGPEPKITLQRASRGKNKSVTVVKGLASFNVDLKAATKFFAGRFACGSSVTATDEVVVQGDFKDDLPEIIVSKWPQITAQSIEDIGDQKR